MRPSLRNCFCAALGIVISFLALGASATTLNGTVNNGTTHRPAAGDEVVLLTFSEAGMTEGARSKTDSAGRFSLPVSDSRMDTVIQVSHQGVTYTQVSNPGANSLAVEVFDSATQLDDIHTVMDVRRLQANSESLQVTQLITVRNESRPRRTLIGDSTLEVEVPPEAHVDAGMIRRWAASLQPLPRDHSRVLGLVHCR